MPPQAIRVRCSGFRYCPDPLGIVPAEQLDKLEYVEKIYAVYTDILYKGYYPQTLSVFCYQENALRNT